MGSVNISKNFPGIITHEGGVAKRIGPEAQLRRLVLSCFLWEKEFYVDGKDIATQILQASNNCSESFVAELAIEARTVHGLRHVPLLLLISLIKRPVLVVNGIQQKREIDLKKVISQVIQRPDEMTELLSMYWLSNGGRKETSKIDRQLVKGLALAFKKFNEYSLAKYNRDTPVKIRDVMFLSHPKPDNKGQEELFKRVANNELVTPDTWEVELSAGKDKKATFERLIKEGKLGYLALLRNLRNMEQAGCDSSLVKEAILARKGAKWVLPFRFVAAARYAPRYEKELDEALVHTIKESPVLPGRTVVLVDVSGSMDYSKISAKSELTRCDAACTLASMINAEDLRMFSFSEKTVEVPPRRGMAGVDALSKSQRHAGTRLSEAVDYVNQTCDYDRLIVITDEQSNSNRAPAPNGKGYMINVASYKNGVGYGGKWIHLDGFSENVIRYIQEIENEV